MQAYTQPGGNFVVFNVATTAATTSASHRTSALRHRLRCVGSARLAPEEESSSTRCVTQSGHRHLSSIGPRSNSIPAIFAPIVGARVEDGRITPEEPHEPAEPTTQAFIDSLAGATPIYTLSPEAARNVLAGAQKSVSVTLAPARSDDRTLNVGPKGRTDIRIYRPENAKGTLPVVIYTHGGGWVLGDRETHDRLVRELTVGANAVVVFVDYDRSPENRYPVAVEESYGVLK